MANLNLSEFGEKLFVTDADHTFIWDTANAISKRVSRNSWLNSGTLTSDAPVTISQTWNAGSNVMTALKVVATDTASGATSNLLELWAGSTPILRFNVAKNGTVAFRSGSVFGDIATDGVGRVLLNASTAAGARVTGDLHIGSNDVILVRDSASGNTLALRNGAAAQTFRVYRSYLNAGVDYERLSFSHDGTQFSIGSERGGSGVAQSLRIYGPSNANLDFANGVSFRNATGSTNFMNISSAGNVGIGTTAPSEKLHVLGGKVLVGDPTDTTGASVNGELTVQAWRAPQLNLAANTASSNFFGLNLKSVSTTLAGFLVNLQSGEVKIGGLSTGGYFSTFYSNNAEAMRISTAGNVGIGTTSPSSKLQVSAGDVEVDTIAKGVILKSPDGTRYRVTVANGGTLSVAAV